MLEKQATTQVLDRECTIFTNYLVRQKPSPYVLAKYHEAHCVNAKLLQFQVSPFDQLLVELSRVNRLTTGLVDAYTALLFRNSLVRKKMVLLLAILESCAPTFAIFEETDADGARFVLGFIRDGLLFAVLAGIAVLVLAPLHLGLDTAALLSQTLKALQGRLRVLRAELPTTSAPAARREMPPDLPSVH